MILNMLRMKSSLLTLLFVVSTAGPALARGKHKTHALPAGASLEKRLRNELSSGGVSDSAVSVYVGLEGNELFAINAHKKFIPASVTKLVTAGAFLRKFPPGAKFKTQLASNAKIQDGSLKGDLYLVGGGDPSFVSENMWYLVNAFLRTGVQKIEGDIVVDDSLFDSLRFDPSRQKERVDRAYDAPVGAMSFNWNSVNIFVRPGAKEGDAATVWADPQNDYVRLVNKVKTTSGSTSVSAERDDDDKGVGDQVKVTGKIAVGSKEVVIYKNINQPDLWSGYNLKSFLAQRNIQLKGNVRKGVAPANIETLAEYESKPIQDILADMNKFSNNYIAEMIAKNISTQSGKKPGSIEGGMLELKRYMSSVGAPDSEFELYNPSGLTRDNKMSSYALWRVLEDLKNDFQLQPELVSSLPIAGVDGTLKNRMKNSVAERWVRAKTGYLNSTVALAGYAGRRNGDVVSFVFIFNGSVDESKVRLVFDRMAASLVEAE
jgi:D-alanyl-D-alanine carboxypeptidase/D-alanyl-D-alanine-endopeptidase (penicillin-binding protein 4)